MTFVPKIREVEVQQGFRRVDLRRQYNEMVSLKGGMMAGRRGRGNSGRSSGSQTMTIERQDNDDREDSDDGDDEFEKDPQIPPQIASSPWNIYAKQDKDYKYFVAITLANRDGGARLFRALCGVVHGDNVHIHPQYNACDYRRIKRSFPKATI